MREFLHQLRRGLPLNREIDAQHWVDGLNEVQVRERRHLSNDELVTRLAAIGPAAAAGRWATLLPMRHLPVPFGQPIGWAPLRYLLDVGFTRDVWALRIDVCIATGREMELSAHHDGRLVADVVAEWASLHGEPFELTLQGPAGGTFVSGSGGENVTRDATEFIRTLAGRRPGAGVLRHLLPL